MNAEAAFDIAFSIAGTRVSWLELVAFALALACVSCNVLEIHWGWPLAIVSSALYGWLFQASRLYGEAALQGLFIVLSAWGWYQWLFGRVRGDVSAAAAALVVHRLEARGMAALVLSWLVLWPLIGALLAVSTDSDVPYLDALATSGSVVAQVLLGRKLLENWTVWVLVNVSSIGLFASKGLVLTAVLYAIFLVLAVVGWVRWSRLARPAGVQASP